MEEEKEEKDEEIELEVVKDKEKEESAEPPTPSGETSVSQVISSPDKDAILAEEMTMLMNEFQTEIVEGVISRVRVYLTISEELNFIIGIDYSNYPGKPLLTVQDELKAIVDPDDLKTIENWKEGMHVVEIFRELEQKLYGINKIKQQIRLISGEFKAKEVEPEHVLVDLLTFGLREYRIDVYLDNLPKVPRIKFSNELKEIVKKPYEELNSVKNWDFSVMSVNDILREIQWEIDKVARLIFEVDLLWGLDKVDYKPEEKKIYIEMKGKLKTADQIFKFEVELPEDYPTSRPTIKIISEVSDDQVAKQMEQAMQILDQWSTFTYLVDVFETISKAILKASIISCIICHKMECPICGKPMIKVDTMPTSPESMIATEGTDASGDVCHTTCPHCEKPYHAHCWDQNIKAIGKCAYCMREPFVPSSTSEDNQI
ncbi:MAG: ubiquitin-conjugating enzyme E2 [Candidatus Helarchaeota archaeon]